MRAAGGRRRALFRLGLAAALAAAHPVGGAEAPRYVTILSGEPGLAYHRQAVALCTAVNRACAAPTKPGRTAPGPRCVVEPTPGSSRNLELLAEGTADLALVQHDVLASLDPDSRVRWHVVRRPEARAEGGPAGAANPNGPEARRRAVVHQEALFVLVNLRGSLMRADGPPVAELDLAALAARLREDPSLSVTLGPRGSGTRATVKARIWPALGGPALDEAQDKMMSLNAQWKAVCSGEVQAAFRISGGEPVPGAEGPGGASALRLDPPPHFSPESTDYCRLGLLQVLPEWAADQEGWWSRSHLEPVRVGLGEDAPVLTVGPMAQLIMRADDLRTSEGRDTLALMSAAMSAALDGAGEASLRGLCDAADQGGDGSRGLKSLQRGRGR